MTYRYRWHPCSVLNVYDWYCTYKRLFVLWGVKHRQFYEQAPQRRSAPPRAATVGHTQHFEDPRGSPDMYGYAERLSNQERMSDRGSERDGGYYEGRYDTCSLLAKIWRWFFLCEQSTQKSPVNNSSNHLLNFQMRLETIPENLVALPLSPFKEFSARIAVDPDIYWYFLQFLSRTKCGNHGKSSFQFFMNWALAHGKIHVFN